jgi:hypothetical protein
MRARSSILERWDCATEDREGAHRFCTDVEFRFGARLQMPLDEVSRVGVDELAAASA